MIVSNARKVRLLLRDRVSMVSRKIREGLAYRGGRHGDIVVDVSEITSAEKIRREVIESVARRQAGRVKRRTIGIDSGGGLF